MTLMIIIAVRIGREILLNLLRIMRFFGKFSFSGTTWFFFPTYPTLQHTIIRNRSTNCICSKQNRRGGGRL